MVTSNDLVKSSPLSDHNSFPSNSNQSQQSNHNISPNSRTSNTLRKHSISDHRNTTAMLALEEFNSSSNNEFSSSPLLTIKAINKENHQDHNNFLTSAGNLV